MVVVKSSNIHSLEYIPEEKELTIEFNSGGVYVYRKVPKDVYDSFLEADSKGKFFFKHIKKNYDFERLQ